MHSGSRSLASFLPPRVLHAKHLAEKILTSKSALEGERKQVTVLFADMKGSMELLADRDPEEARKLLDPMLEHMMEAVHRYEGTVNQVMGDGIMALFGAPLAHEDHAVRACYAALRMQESVKRYAEGVRRTEGIPIQIRVGLNSGEVVVRSIGSDLKMDYTAVGQTTHLAARMEQMAMPGSILMTAGYASTGRRLCAGDVNRPGQCQGDELSRWKFMRLLELEPHVLVCKRQPRADLLALSGAIQKSNSFEKRLNRRDRPWSGSRNCWRAWRWQVAAVLRVYSFASHAGMVDRGIRLGLLRQGDSLSAD